MEENILQKYKKLKSTSENQSSLKLNEIKLDKINVPMFAK